MSARNLNVIAVSEDGFGLDDLRAALPIGTPLQAFQLGEGNGSAVAAAKRADLVVVACSIAHDDAIDVIAAAAQRPERPVVVLYEGSPNGFLSRAFEAGADDLLALPQPAGQLAFALEKAFARKQGTGSAASHGELVTVLGPKGGTGKTMTSTNLAVAFARAGKTSVVVDLDLQFGDVGLALGLQPKRTIFDLVVAGGTLDGEKVDDFLAQHESGARALLAPLRPDQAASVTMPFLREVLEVLRTRYDYVLVDTPPAFTPEVIAAVDASTHLCVVGMLDALSLKDTKIGLETLEQMGHDPKGVTLVLNRSDSDVGITVSDIAQLLGRAPDVHVPSDRAIPRALTAGQPIVVAEPKSKAARAYTALAETYLSASARKAKLEAAGTVALNGNHGRRRLSLRKAS